MKKGLKRGIAVASAVMSLMLIVPTGAEAAWEQDNTGWWYTEGNSYATGWRNIDGNWYYFYSNGYMAANEFINGYYVDSNGAWISNVDLFKTLNNDIEDAVSIFGGDLSSKDYTTYGAAFYKFDGIGLESQDYPTVQYIWIYGDNGYTIKGIKYGDNISEAADKLINEGWRCSTNKSTFKHFTNQDNVTIELTADSNGNITNIMATLY